MSLFHNTWILVRACIDAMPFRSPGSRTRTHRRSRHIPLDFLEHRELMAADVPTLSDISKTIHLNVAQSTYTFKVSDFASGFHDAAGAKLAQIEIVTLPDDGQLALNGNAVTAQQLINVSDIPNLTYFYNPSSTYTGSDAFSWSAKNSTTAANTAANFTLLLPDKAPTLANISKTIQSRTSPRFNLSDFTKSFKDADSGDTLFQVTIETLPAHGTLLIYGGDSTTRVAVGTFGNVNAGDKIALGQLANLVYEPNAGYTGADSFSFTASDLLRAAAHDANVLINVTPAPALTVTGGGEFVPNHSSATSPANFTDFGGMTTTADSGLGNNTRQFVIANNGNTTINLTGSKGKLIQISGPNAADFKVITPPAKTTLAPGQLVTFTVEFAPKANDTRHATLTIPNSTGKPYTFDISGTGLITQSAFVTVNSSTGSSFAQVDWGTVVIGHGDTAFPGDQLTVTYSGFTLNYPSSTSGVPAGFAGLVFDSTENEGGKPFTFNLGQSQVIQGWDQVLAGMKVGETRVLMIPAGAAYQGSGQGDIAPNASLEFTISLLKVTKPTLVVSGNGQTINSGDKSPSLTDGTNFGTLANGTVSSSAHTFTIAPKDVGAIRGATVSIEGANPSDFTVTQPLGNGTLASKNFTVTFKPTRNGLRTAIIHVHSGVASNPDYTFTVQGNSSPYNDLTASLGTATGLPTTVILKGTPSFTVPLTITNIGTSPLPAGATTDVHFFLKDTTTGTQISFPQSTPALNVSSLGAGASKTFNLSLKLPASLVAGTYKLVAVINNKHGVKETLATNDTATSTQKFNVEPVTTNLSGHLVSSTLPTTLTAGQTASGNITVSVDNSGNQKMPANQHVTLTVIARDIVFNTNTILTVSGPLSVADLAGHSSMQFTVPVKSSKALAAGSYNYQVLITPVQTLKQSSTADDLISRTASNTTFGLKVAQPDISASLGNSTLPASIKAGSKTTNVGTLGIVVTNTTGSALPDSEQVKITVLAHPTAGGSDITLLPANTRSLGSLGALANTTINVGLSFTGEKFTAGNYTLQAQVTLVPAVTESNTTNNLATLNAANKTITLTATA